MTKVYVVHCHRDANLFDPTEGDTWVESVHSTEKGAQDCIRKCNAQQLQDQLKAVLKSPVVWSPELPLSWTYKEMKLKD